MKGHGEVGKSSFSREKSLKDILWNSGSLFLIIIFSPAIWTLTSVVVEGELNNGSSN